MSTKHIKKLPTSRQDLIAYEIDGHISHDDVIAVYTELLAAFQAHEKIDLLVKMVNFDGFDWSAVFTDTTYATKTQSLKHLRRYAIVGGPSWIRSIATIFDPLFTVQMKTFELTDEAKAMAWLNED